MEYHIKCCNCGKESEGNIDEPSTPKECDSCGKKGHDMITGEFYGWEEVNFS